LTFDFFVSDMSTDAAAAMVCTADDRVRTFPIDEYICRGVSRPLTLISPLPPEHVNRLIELVSLVSFEFSV